MKEKLQMSEKCEFKGDVGQAVIGSIQEAQRLNNSNYVSVNLNNPKAEEPKITARQKAKIFGKVKELMAARQLPDTNDHRLTIYGAILDQFHVNRIDDLPDKHFKGVIAMMSRWITEALDQWAVSPPDTAATAAPALTVRRDPALISITSADSDSQAAVEESTSLLRLQRIVRAQSIALVVCIAICGWVLYKMGLPFMEKSPVVLPDNRCYIAGKAYSIGHVERLKGSLGMQCVGPIGDMPAMWLDANRGR